MKAIAFNGSPRNDGNTHHLLGKILEPIKAAGVDTELVQVGGKPIHGCTACMWCAENQRQKCVIDDDQLNEHLRKMIEADAIILGSPSYFADMTSDMKALIDRAGFVAHTNGGLLARKIGAAVAVHRRGGATHVFDSINHFFLMSRMIVPGSTYWNFGVGMQPADVADDREALDNMRDLGETIAWLLQRLHA
ncbi:MAG: flavodoxin family protein [Verrucomicrobiota bacterium]